MSRFSLSVLAFLCLRSVALVNAALFVVNPFNGSICWGGQSCAVSYEDDGVKPLLPTIGVSRVELKVAQNNGNQLLVQTLSPVNVGTTPSFSFTPSPEEGSNSDRYYLVFTSTKFYVSEGVPYRGYSPFFQLSGMTGSFNSPLLAATSLVPIPQSIETPPTSLRTSTITVGTLLPYPSSSPLPTPSVTSSISGFSTSTTTTQISSASLSTTSAPAKTNGSSSHLPRRAPVLFLALFSSFLFS